LLLQIAATGAARVEVLVVTSRLLFVVLDLLHRSLRSTRIAANSHVVGRRHDAGLGGAMVASASTIAAVVGAGTIVTVTVVGAGTIVTVTVTIVAIVATIIATIVAITIATVALTASAGGILVGATSLARTIVRSFSRTLAARLVLHMQTSFADFETDIDVMNECRRIKQNKAYFN
jgi:hypothetical protein